ncbi:hypothetical protein KKB44_02895 [Candidatus Micrarchaeota archaeon]|nr:hypothetical protein [Candidatus Micrarchaeota archaeon]
MKAQVSMEFLFVLSALMVIFVVFTTIYLGEKVNLFQTEESLATLGNAYRVSAAINYVHLAGDGAQYNFTVGKIDRENITIATVSVESKRPYAASQAPLLNGNVNTTTIEGGQMLIKNNNGAIEIE